MKTGVLRELRDDRIQDSKVGHLRVCACVCARPCVRQQHVSVRAGMCAAAGCTCMLQHFLAVRSSEVTGRGGWTGGEGTLHEASVEHPLPHQTTPPQPLCPKPPSTPNPPLFPSPLTPLAFSPRHPSTSSSSSSSSSSSPLAMTG